MAAYISFGVNPAHLLSASVMSAPAALAAAKLLLPETKKRPSSSLRSGGGGLDEEEANGDGGDDADRESFRLSPSHSGDQEDKNLLSAATSGAINAATLVLNITAIVIAVIAFVAFLDAVVAFLAGLVGFPQLTFKTILGYAFMPLAFIMGVEWAECHTVGTLSLCAHRLECRGANIIIKSSFLMTNFSNLGLLLEKNIFIFLKK